VYPLPDGGRARFQPIAATDVARVIARALERSATIGGTYALGGPAALTLRQMAERIFLAMDVQRVILPLPVSVLRPILALLQRVLPNPPVTTSLLDLLGVDNTVADNALWDVFEVEPTPFAPEEIAYLKQITVRDALRSLVRG
jgi:NADH dehydrogenase